MPYKAASEDVELEEGFQSIFLPRTSYLISTGNELETRALLALRQIWKEEKDIHTHTHTRTIKKKREQIKGGNENVLKDFCLSFLGILEALCVIIESIHHAITLPWFPYICCLPQCPKREWCCPCIKQNSNSLN